MTLARAGGAPQRNTVLTRKNKNNKDDHHSKSSISLGGLFAGKFSPGDGGKKDIIVSSGGDAGSGGGGGATGSNAKGGKASGQQGIAIGSETGPGMVQNRASGQAITTRGSGLADKLTPPPPIKESGQNNAELGIAKVCKQELIDHCNSMAR